MVAWFSQTLLWTRMRTIRYCISYVVFYHAQVDREPQKMHHQCFLEVVEVVPHHVRDFFL